MAILVEIKLGDGTRVKTPITDAFILSKTIAYKRGLSELYDQWYLKKNRNIQIPFDKTMDEGQRHYINNPRVGIEEDAILRSVTHVLIPKSQLTTINAESVVRFE